MGVRLRYTINTHLKDRGLATPTAIGAAVGLPAAAAVRLLTRRQWRDGDLTAMQAAAHHLGLELLDDLKRVGGKQDLLFNLANAAVEKPDGTMREVVFPVLGEQTLRDLLRESKRLSRSRTAPLPGWRFRLKPTNEGLRVTAAVPKPSQPAVWAVTDKAVSVRATAGSSIRPAHRNVLRTQLMGDADELADPRPAVFRSPWCRAGC